MRKRQILLHLVLMQHTKNIIDMINQLDIYNQVVLGIPLVVWSENGKQIIEKHE